MRARTDGQITAGSPRPRGLTGGLLRLALLGGGLLIGLAIAVAFMFGTLAGLTVGAVALALLLVSYERHHRYSSYAISVGELVKELDTEFGEDANPLRGADHNAAAALSALDGLRQIAPPGRLRSLHERFVQLLGWPEGDAIDDAVMPAGRPTQIRGIAEEINERVARLN